MRDFKTVASWADVRVVRAVFQPNWFRALSDQILE
jgi:hypothetical protein